MPRIGCALLCAKDRSDTSRFVPSRSRCPHEDVCSQGLSRSAGRSRSPASFRRGLEPRASSSSQNLPQSTVVSVGRESRKGPVRNGSAHAGSPLLSHFRRPRDAGLSRVGPISSPLPPVELLILWCVPNSSSRPSSVLVAPQYPRNFVPIHTSKLQPVMILLLRKSKANIISHVLIVHGALAPSLHAVTRRAKLTPSQCMQNAGRRFSTPDRPTLPHTPSVALYGACGSGIKYSPQPASPQEKCSLKFGNFQRWLFLCFETQGNVNDCREEEVFRNVTMQRHSSHGNSPPSV